MTLKNNPRIGTAGWNLPAEAQDNFPIGKSQLERYSQVFNAVEINSSFHKAHKKTIYERWCDSTPENFQFSVKMFKEITHNKKLIGVEDDLDKFFQEIAGLKNKLGILLIQLPPSLVFEQNRIDIFFELLRKMFDGKVVIEPRNSSWAESTPQNILKKYDVSYVKADPIKFTINAKQTLKYYRLHGSPLIYKSSYDDQFLKKIAKDLTPSSWVIFDNTQFGAGTQNALDLKQLKKNSG